MQVAKRRRRMESLIFCGAKPLKGLTSKQGRNVSSAVQDASDLNGRRLQTTKDAVVACPIASQIVSNFGPCRANPRKPGNRLDSLFNQIQDSIGGLRLVFGNMGPD